eukprot:15454093-Alexandrium_andersonii.AAC.1
MNVQQQMYNRAASRCKPLQAVSSGFGQFPALLSGGATAPRTPQKEDLWRAPEALCGGDREA